MPICSSLALAGLLALADGPPATIDWRAPPECPDAAAVAAMTETLLRERAAADVQLEVHATVVRAARRYHLTLELRAEHEHLERALAADTCTPLARAVALLVAVHLDPLRVSQTIAQPLAEADAPRTTAPPPPGFDDERAPGLSPLFPREPTPPEPRLGGHLRFEGGLGHGVLPALTGELALLGGAWGRRWRVEGGLAATPWREVAARDGSVGGRFARLTAVLRGCARWPVRREGGAIALLGCVGAEAGALAAVGTRGVATPSGRWTPWGAVLLGPAVRVRLAGPLGLWIGVEAVVPLRRPIFTAGVEDLFRVAPAAVRATLGLDLQIVARKRRVTATN